MEKGFLKIGNGMIKYEGGLLFWERNKWIFNNENGSQGTAYDELATLLDKIAWHGFGRYYGSLIVKIHDEDGVEYILYCDCDTDIGGPIYLTAEWDWMECQNKFYFDWAVMLDSLDDYLCIYNSRVGEMRPELVEYMPEEDIL